MTLRGIVPPMENIQPRETSYPRYVHEFLFSLNIALVAKLEGNQKPNKLFSLLDSHEVTMQLKINAYLHLHPHHQVGANSAFFAIALSLALCIFLVLRISSSTYLSRQFLRTVAGFLSLLALPASWLYVAHLLGSFSLLPNPPYALLLLELLSVTVCAALYLYSKWPLPAWGTIALLLLHYSFWNWLVSGGPLFWRDPFRLIFPMAGFCSSLAWGYYVRYQGSAQN